MSVVLRVSILVGILIYVLAIFTLLKKKRLNLKYSLLWFLSAVILLIMLIFPNAVTKVSRLLGVESPVNAVFLIIIFLMLLLLMSLTSIVSTQHEQIKKLVQEIAILKNKENSDSK